MVLNCTDMDGSDEWSSENERGRDWAYPFDPALKARRDGLLLMSDLKREGRIVDDEKQMLKSLNRKFLSIIIILCFLLILLLFEAIPARWVVGQREVERVFPELRPRAAIPVNNRQ